MVDNITIIRAQIPYRAVYGDGKAKDKCNIEGLQSDAKICPPPRWLPQASIHWNTYFAPLLCVLISGLFIYFGEGSDVYKSYLVPALIVVSFVVLCKRDIDSTYSEFVVTNKRLFHKTGFMRVRTKEIQLSSVEGVNIDLFFNSETLKVMGTGGKVSVFKNIADPIEFRNRIQSQRVQ